MYNIRPRGSGGSHVSWGHGADTLARRGGADRKGSGGHTTEKPRPSRHRGVLRTWGAALPTRSPWVWNQQTTDMFWFFWSFVQNDFQKKRFRISAWALNICKDSETCLHHRVGFQGSEGPTWPGGGGEWGFTRSREWPLSPQLLRDSPDDTASWGGGRGVTLFSGAGAGLPPGCPSSHSPSKPSSEG